LADTQRLPEAETKRPSTLLLSKRKKKFEQVPDKGLGIVTESGEVILQTKKPDE